VVTAAIEHLDVAIELDPNRAESHRLLAAVYLADRREDEAVAELETAARLDPDDERIRLALANALVEAGRYPDAERALGQTIERLPASGRARYALAGLYQRQGLYEQAVSELAAAVAHHPLIGLNGIYQSLGAMAAARQNFDAAVDAYEKRVDVHPNDADGHQDLGETYARLGRHAEALAEFAMVSTLATGRADAFTAMAQVHLKEERYTEAVEACRRALDLNPAYAPAHYTLGTSLVRLGRTDEGQEELKEFQRLQADAAATHAREIELGGLRREASESSANGDHEKAVSLLRKALQLEPDAAVSHLNLGLALLYAGKPAEAIERFEAAVRLRAPIEVHQHLAQAYAALGNLDESRKELGLYEQLRQENLRRAGANRVAAVPEQRRRDRDEAQEDRVFPAAAGRAEHPAIAKVRQRRAEQDRGDRQREQPRAVAGDERGAGDELGDDGHVGERAGQADLLEECGSAGGREDDDLHQAVGEEDGAKREPQHQRGEVDATVVHEGLLGFGLCGKAATEPILDVVDGEIN